MHEVAPAALIRPDPDDRADGIIIETSVLARLLGVRLLTLEGTVVLSPAQVRAFGASGPDADPRPAATSSAPAALGPALQQAGRLIAASAADLAAVDDPGGRPGGVTESRRVRGAP